MVVHQPDISQTGAATATHSFSMQSWTSQQRKSQTLRKNVQSTLGIKPKVFLGWVNRPDKRPLAPKQKHRVAFW